MTKVGEKSPKHRKREKEGGWEGGREGGSGRKGQKLQWFSFVDELTDVTCTFYCIS